MTFAKFYRNDGQQARVTFDGVNFWTEYYLNDYKDWIFGNKYKSRFDAYKELENAGYHRRDY